MCNLNRRDYIKYIFEMLAKVSNVMAWLPYQLHLYLGSISPFSFNYFKYFLKWIKCHFNWPLQRFQIWIENILTWDRRLQTFSNGKQYTIIFNGLYDALAASLNGKQALLLHFGKRNVVIDFSRCLSERDFVQCG